MFAVASNSNKIPEFDLDQLQEIESKTFSKYYIIFLKFVLNNFLIALKNKDTSMKTGSGVQEEQKIEVI